MELLNILVSSRDLLARMEAVMGAFLSGGLDRSQFTARLAPPHELYGRIRSRLAALSPAHPFPCRYLVDALDHGLQSLISRFWVLVWAKRRWPDVDLTTQ